MKRLTVGFLTLLAATGAALAQQPLYQNLGNLTAPPAPIPQIDANAFDNEGLFNIGFNNFAIANSIGVNGGFVFTTSLPAFDFSDVMTFTNRGTMSSDTGFTFDFAPSTNGFRRMAASFTNANTGSILAGSATSPFTTNTVIFAGNLFQTLTGVSILTVKATNVANTGLLDVGAGGLLQMSGNNLDLHRGTCHVEGFDDQNVVLVLGEFGTFITGTLGIFDNYEGIGRQTNQLSQANFTLPDPFSPLNNVTNTAAVPTFSLVAPPLASAFVNVQSPNPSNICFQVVFVNTNLPGVSTDVRFEPGSVEFAIPIIQWESHVTNSAGAFGSVITTNDLYLADQFGSFPTNFVITNGFSLSGIPTIAPYNYSFFRSFPAYSFLPHGNGTFDTQGIFGNAFPATNAYAALGVTLAPVTTFPDPTLPGSTFTNTAGRIQIDAATSLDLTSAKITGPNYLKLFSTNHFVGSANASIVSPYMDINLGTTNGSMTVTNLVAPYIPRFSGPIDCWSGRWTNVVNGFTNTFHVLIVNAQFSPTSLPIVLNCALRSTNIVVNDALNVNQTLLVNANNLTIASNDPASLAPYGQINELSGDILWSKSFPTLQNFTNFGLLSAQNTIFFFGARQLPYYPTNFTEPYQSLVNHGLILSSGVQAWANHFENTGAGLIVSNSSVASTAGITFFAPVSTTSNNSAQIFSEVGPITVNADSALMTSGGFTASSGDITIGANALTISNHFLTASGALTFSVTNAMTDGGVTSNFWSAGDGVNLLVKPPTGDFLGTTINNFCPAGLEVINIWAGIDRGASDSAFVNNGTVGHLILDGGDITSTFFFGGPDNVNSYALYVDLLELRDGATNRTAVNGIQQFTAFDIAPNMKIYFSDAVLPGGIDISEKLNGANGGHLVWVPSFQGPFNGTNSASGQANSINPGASSLKLSMGTAGQPHTPSIKWNAPANSTNYLYYTTNLASANWQLVTNFVQGASAATVSITDYGRTNSAGFYKVQVYPHQ